MKRGTEPEVFKDFDFASHERQIRELWGGKFGKIPIVEDRDLPRRQSRAGFLRLAQEFDEIGGGTMAPANMKVHTGPPAPTEFASHDEWKAVYGELSDRDFTLRSVIERLEDALLAMVARGEVPADFETRPDIEFPDGRRVGQSFRTYQHRALRYMLHKRFFRRWERMAMERPTDTTGISPESLDWFPNQLPPEQARRALLDLSFPGSVLGMFLSDAFGLEPAQFRHTWFMEARGYQGGNRETPTMWFNWIVTHAQSLADLCRVIAERMRDALESPAFTRSESAQAMPPSPIGSMVRKGGTRVVSPLHSLASFSPQFSDGVSVRLRRLAARFGEAAIHHHVEIGMYVYPPRYLKLQSDVAEVYLARMLHADLPPGRAQQFGGVGSAFGLPDGDYEVLLRQHGSAEGLANFDSIATACWRELDHAPQCDALASLIGQAKSAIPESKDDAKSWCVLLFLAAWSGNVPTIRADRSTYRGMSTETPPTSLWSPWEHRHQPFALMHIDPVTVPSTLEQFVCRLDTQAFVASQSVLDWAASIHERVETDERAKPAQPIGDPEIHILLGAPAAARAFDMLTKHPEMVNATSSKWAAALGVTEQTVRGLDIWKKRKALGNSTRRQRGQAISDAVSGEAGPVEQAIANERQAELERLIKEQEVDRKRDGLDLSDSEPDSAGDQRKSALPSARNVKNRLNRPRNGR